MSGKQAKKLRKAQRQNGIEPALDARRRAQREAAAALEAKRTEAEIFRRDHPEEYEAQQREARLQLRRAVSAVSTVLAVLG